MAETETETETETTRLDDPNACIRCAARLVPRPGCLFRCPGCRAQVYVTSAVSLPLEERVMRFLQRVRFLPPNRFNESIEKNSLDTSARSSSFVYLSRVRRIEWVGRRKRGAHGRRPGRQA